MKKLSFCIIGLVSGMSLGNAQDNSVPPTLVMPLTELVSPVFSAELKAPLISDIYEYKILRVNLAVLRRSPMEFQQQLNLWGTQGWRISQKLTLPPQFWEAIIILEREKPSKSSF